MSKVQLIENKKSPPKRMSFGASAITGALASCLSEAVSFPFDFAKTRLQIQGYEQHIKLGATGAKPGLASASASFANGVVTSSSQSSAYQYRGMIDVLRSVVKTRGISAVFDGLKPALLRQATYGTLKIMFYEEFKTWGVADSTGPSQAPQFVQSMNPTVRALIAGATSGALSSAICNPTDLLKVRMQAGDRKYAGLWDAFRSVIREEGYSGLYKGVGPTTQRATMVAVLTLPTYDLTKAWLLAKPRLGFQLEDNTVTHSLASIVSVIVSVYGSQPADTIKSRVMNQPVGADGRGLLYRNSMHCLSATVRNEGLSALFKGTVPSLCRNAPWLVVFWLSYERLKRVALQIEGKA